MSAFKIILILTALVSFVKSQQYTSAQQSLSLQAEQALVAKLLNSYYSRDVRPQSQVSVYVNIQLKQIISLDEKNQILSITCFIEQYWLDPRLSWDPTQNSDINVVMLNLKKIWSPDTIVMNSGDGDGYLKINADYSYVPVRYDGTVYFSSSLIALKTRCSLSLGNYPFDTQNCTVRLASWAYGDNKINYLVNFTTVDLSDYTPHPVWTIYEGTDAISSDVKGDRVPFEDTSNTEVVLLIYLTRKALYYMMNQVFPGFLLNIVTLLTFFMPPSMGTGIVMSGFITFGVYAVSVSNSLPTQSDYVPDMSSYFFSSIALNFIAFAWFLYMNRCLLRSEMPAFLQKFGELVKKLFCLCFPPDHKKDKKTSSPKAETVDSQTIVVTTESDKQKPVENLENTGKTEDKKCKCGFCDRCSDCEADFKKDKDKGKRKKEIESSFEALNYLAFVIMFIALVSTNLGVWINIKKS